MEDYVVAQFKQVEDNELGLFAIFDGHLSHEIPNYLRTHLFENILKEVKLAMHSQSLFWFRWSILFSFSGEQIILYT